jgi:hypothetical protein
MISALNPLTTSCLTQSATLVWHYSSIPNNNDLPKVQKCSLYLREKPEDDFHHRYKASILLRFRLLLPVWSLGKSLQDFSTTVQSTYFWLNSGTLERPLESGLSDYFSIRISNMKSKL